ALVAVETGRPSPRVDSLRPMGESSGLRVVLAEDSYLIREGLRRLLAEIPEIELVASVGSLGPPRLPAQGARRRPCPGAARRDRRGCGRHGARPDGRRLARPRPRAQGGLAPRGPYSSRARDPREG